MFRENYMMQGRPDHYNLTTPLAKKYSHSTYLASSNNESARQVIVIVFSPSLFSSLRERKAFLQKVQHLYAFNTAVVPDRVDILS
jgi:hypothetical protein